MEMLRVTKCVLTKTNGALASVITRLILMITNVCVDEIRRPLGTGRWPTEVTCSFPSDTEVILSYLTYDKLRCTRHCQRNVKYDDLAVPGLRRVVEICRF